MNVYIHDECDDSEEIEKSDLLPNEVIEIFKNLTSTQSLEITGTDDCKLYVSKHGSISIKSKRNSVDNSSYELNFEELILRIRLLGEGKINELIDREWTHGYGFQPKPYFK